jgi:hypothetical protein
MSPSYQIHLSLDALQNLPLTNLKYGIWRHTSAFPQEIFKCHVTAMRIGYDHATIALVTLDDRENANEDRGRLLRGQFFGGVSYQIRILMYHDVSCMYPACILKDTRILSVS